MSPPNPGGTIWPVSRSNSKPSNSTTSRPRAFHETRSPESTVSNRSRLITGTSGRLSPAVSLPPNPARRATWPGSPGRWSRSRRPIARPARPPAEIRWLGRSDCDVPAPRSALPGSKSGGPDDPAEIVAARPPAPEHAARGEYARSAQARSGAERDGWFRTRRFLAHPTATIDSGGPRIRRRHRSLLFRAFHRRRPSAEVSTRRMPISIDTARRFSSKNRRLPANTRRKDTCRTGSVRGRTMGLDVALGVIILIAAIRGWLQGFLYQAIRHRRTDCVRVSGRAGPRSGEAVHPALLADDPSGPGGPALVVGCGVRHLCRAGGATTLALKMTKRPEIPGIPPQRSRNDQFAGFLFGIAKGALIAAFLAAGIQTTP